MQRGALAVAKYPGKIENPPFARCQQLLAGEFRRRAQIALHRCAIGAAQLGSKGMQVGLVTGRRLQDAGLHLEEIMLCEPLSQPRRNPAPGQQERPPVGMQGRSPPGGRLGHS